MYTDSLESACRRHEAMLMQGNTTRHAEHQTHRLHVPIAMLVQCSDETFLSRIKRMLRAVSPTKQASQPLLSTAHICEDNPRGTHDDDASQNPPVSAAGEVGEHRSSAVLGRQGQCRQVVCMCRLDLRGKKSQVHLTPSRDREARFMGHVFYRHRRFNVISDREKLKRHLQQVHIAKSPPSSC